MSHDAVWISVRSLRVDLRSALRVIPACLCPSGGRGRWWWVVGGWTKKKSLRPADHSAVSTSQSLVPPLRIFTANFCALCVPPSLPAQVYGLFEGMLEKLELEDDGEC